MSQDIHDQAEHLLLKSAVEGLTPEEGSWLGRHLGECASCCEVATRLEEVAGSLRSMVVVMDSSLVERTRARIRRRAADLAPRKASKILLWSACATTWAWIMVSAPYIWRGFAWLGGKAGCPEWVWEMGFGLWWLFPALTIGIALMGHKSIETSHEDDWAGI